MTEFFLLEIGNALAKLRYRSAAVKFLAAMEEDPNVEIVPLYVELYNRGWQLYRERRDKEWSLTDCISFIVMQERRSINDGQTFPAGWLYSAVGRKASRC